jgi:hypothetical protein
METTRDNGSLELEQQAESPEAVDGAPTITHLDLANWRGHDVVDARGKRIGKLEEVYFDVDSDEPHFGTVRRGWVAPKLQFVPLVGAVVGPDAVRVATTLDELKKAPSIGSMDAITPEAESALYHHYRLNYTPTGKRRLVRH